MMKNTILNVEELNVKFATDNGLVTAINDLSFHVKQQETLCIVGESGSGKSVSALSIMGLLPKPSGIISKGKIEFYGKDLVKYSESQMQKIRGNRISMIFQEPMTTLNPVYTIGSQISETLIKHRRMSKKEALEYSKVMLDKVGVSDPSRRVKQYPHELSGGIRQRVMISMALACEPDILIADEPTTALDVTVQAQVLQLIEDLKKEYKMSVIFITHDLGVVYDIADRIIVMYGGMKVEEAPAKKLFSNPSHPYSNGLLQCLPQMGQYGEKLKSIPGIVPSLWNMPEGCRFSTRCRMGTDNCICNIPYYEEISTGHYVLCHKFAKEGALSETDKR